MMQRSKSFSRLAIRAFYILLVVAMLMSVMPTQQAQAAKCKFKHKVKAGETLIYIADLYQTDWKEIAEANDLKEPYILTVGQVLCIPMAPSRCLQRRRLRAMGPQLQSPRSPFSRWVQGRIACMCV